MMVGNSEEAQDRIDVEFIWLRLKISDTQRKQCTTRRPSASFPHFTWPMATFDLRLSTIYACELIAAPFSAVYPRLSRLDRSYFAIWLSSFPISFSSSLTWKGTSH